MGGLVGWSTYASKHKEVIKMNAITTSKWKLSITVLK